MFIVAFGGMFEFAETRYEAEQIAARMRPLFRDVEIVEEEEFIDGDKIEED